MPQRDRWAPRARSSSIHPPPSPGLTDSVPLGGALKHGVVWCSSFAVKFMGWNFGSGICYLVTSGKFLNLSEPQSNGILKSTQQDSLCS